MVSKAACLLPLVGGVFGQLDAIPKGFQSDQWAWVSNEDPLLAAIPGAFNRTVFDAPSAANVTDQRVASVNDHIQQSSFVAYDQRFFDVIGPNATVEQLQVLPFQVHEAPCYVKESSQLFFVEWGPPGGSENGRHDWQYLLDLKTNNLTRIKTDPPTWNVHGCVYRDGNMHVVTDGGPDETGYLAIIDPATLKRTTLLNNYFERPFISFNDIELDHEGNYYLTDSRSGFGRSLHPFNAPTQPTVYFVNGTNMRIKELAMLEGNANGITLSPDGKTLYVADTGASESKPARRNDQGPREMWAWDFATSSHGAKIPLLVNQRMLSRAIEYFYDGIRTSSNGLIFAAGGEVVDVIDPESGWTLGSIRVGGNGNDPVNIALGDHEMWIVGKGGVWHVKNIKERLSHTE
ncbi:hypothetical protein WHR41_04792 [Cladosporium halotolerans]|uniref:SMP-30/Gluconolactonase/LRE-like region domain-containing protein n=1 Tax=Cladosporium halotolerans TaxID=1052096 RepID=A0AB34KLU9_9PEZI